MSTSNGKAGGIPSMKTIKITTLSRHVLDIIRYVAIFYVVHVIHWLLKYVNSNDKYSKVWSFAVGSKCWQVTLRFNCHNNSHFSSKKESAISVYRVTMPLLFESTQIVFIFKFMLQFVTLFFFISVLVMLFLTFYLSRLQTIYLVFSDPANNFFQYFSSARSRKRIIRTLWAK